VKTDLHDPLIATPGSEWHNDAWDDPDELQLSQTAPRRRRGKVFKWFVLVAAILLVGAALTGGAVGMWVIRQVNPPGTAGAPLTFVVSDDDTLVTISHRLKDQGFIAHAGVFEWYVKRKGGLEFEPGYYSLRPRDTMGNIVAALRTSPNETFTSVTFPEGLTARQIGNRLSETVPRLSSARFLDAVTDGEVTSAYLPDDVDTLEGLLFPDTYQVSNGESERQVVARMVKLMERVGRQEGLDDELKRHGLTPYQILIVASMIEKEAKFDEDRPKIARVIYNRLELGMPLQIDATLRYQEDPDTPFAELRAKDTPYNTYLYKGLPPTPIANPGRASIRAALNPAVDPPPGDPICLELSSLQSCRYLYYVLSDKAGHHVFAATAEQHERNVQAARDAGVIG